MIDWARVRELRDEIGEEEFAEVVDLFLEEVDDAVAKLRADPNPDTFEADLHFLKGSALNLGFRNLGALCQTGESLAADGRQDEVALDPILTCYDMSRSKFLAEIGGGLAA